MAARLTIVLPLKGRHLFTLRFLWHANRARLPYRILIADGQVHPALAGVLENAREHFPNLDIEYVHYPDDQDFRRFFAKMADALERVATPYAMIADNDDFVALAGTERSLDFLEANPDYVCCGGGIATFAVYAGLDDPHGGLLGRLNGFEYRHTLHERSADLGSSSAVERLRQGSRNWWSYYAAFRTPALATIFREIREIDFSDLQLYEFYCAMRAMTLGKARSDGSTIAYLRQYGTSLQTSFKKDWVHHLLRSRFTSDFATMIDRVSAQAAVADGANQAQVAEMLRGICEEWLREFLRVYYGSLQSVKQFLRDHAPIVIKWLKMRRRYFVDRERAALFSQLAADGAAADYLAQFETELGAIEDVLSGDAFAAFAQPYLPAFAAGSAGACSRHGTSRPADAEAAAAGTIHENLIREKDRFAFGSNWRSFLAELDDARIAEAEKSLQWLFGRQRLDGVRLVDIGSGSGLSSLAARRLGAAVCSFDYDAQSVECTKTLRDRFFLNDPNWQIEQGSILDRDYLDKLGTFDIVYSWGVLHHTGAMREAIDNAARLVAPGGLFAFALYRKTRLCWLWSLEKRWYSGASSRAQSIARDLYIGVMKSGFRLLGRDFNAYVAKYASKRGMSFVHDVHDWLGGYPYESVRPSDVAAQMSRLGFVQVRSKVQPYSTGLFGSGCDEYVYCTELK